MLPTPFLPAGVFDQWGLAADDPRRNTTAVLNPLEADRPELATTLLPALLGMWVGQRVRAGLGADSFRRWFFAGLLALGLAMLWRAIG